MIVVKVGGSLYDRPDLGPGLRAFLDGLRPGPILVVAGGGDLGDVVRDLDAIHGLGDEVAHGLALTATNVATSFLGQLLGLYRLTAIPEWWEDPSPPVQFLICDAFLFQYEDRYGPVPHTWDLTSDSIAAYAAAVGKARLVLLKSVDVPPGTPWEEAAARGWVDPHFPAVVAAHGLRVEVVNFRRWLDERGPRP